MDVHNKHARSYNMSRIRGKNTKPEMLVRKYLFARRFGGNLLLSRWILSHQLNFCPDAGGITCL